VTATAQRLRDMSPFSAGKGAGTEGGERLGNPSLQRPKGCLIWLITREGKDAGGVLSICQELSFLREEPVNCLVTTESDSPLVPSVANSVIHQLTPVDTQGSVARFHDHWKPDVGLVLGDVESTKLIKEAAGRRVPLFYVARKRGIPRRFPQHLALMQACLTGSAAEARWLRSEMGEDDTSVEITGPLSDTSHALACNDAECNDLAALLGGRPVWLAAGVHLGEIDMIEAAHRRAFRGAHRMLLILVPANPEDAPVFREKIHAAGWQTGLRSDGEEPEEDVQVYIADTEGELGLWYRLAPTSFVGGSFVADAVSSDPFDPAALGSAVLHGPHVGDVAPRFKRLAEAGGAMSVEDADDLGEALQSLLAPDKAATLAQAGWSVTTESAGVVERLVELIDLALEEAETR
jgi:3-deoxy-D-manno-octulosonic-acid transferase